MKKKLIRPISLFAFSCVVSIGTLLLYNIRTLDALIEGVETHVCRSSAALACGDSKLAASELETAMERWRGAEGYTHIFIRHSEIDAVWDAFFELNAALRGAQEADESLYLDLLYHLDSLARMEELLLGSIL